MARLATKTECIQQSERARSAYIPLSEAALCEELKCGAVFNAIHHEACPACGYRHAVLLASCPELLQVMIEEALWESSHRRR